MVAPGREAGRPDREAGRRGWQAGRRSGMSFAVAVDSRRGARVSAGGADLGPLLAGDKAEWDRFVARPAAVIFATVRRRLVPAGLTAHAPVVEMGRVSCWGRG